MAEDEYVLVTPNEIVVYDQKPWEQMDDGAWWFCAERAAIYPREEE